MHAGKAAKRWDAGNAARSAGLSRRAAVAVVHLDRLGGRVATTTRDLAAALGWTQATATRALREACRGGVLTREGGRGRGVPVYLTPSGGVYLFGAVCDSQTDRAHGIPPLDRAVRDSQTDRAHGIPPLDRAVRDSQAATAGVFGEWHKTGSGANRGGRDSQTPETPTGAGGSATHNDKLCSGFDTMGAGGSSAGAAPFGNPNGQTTPPPPPGNGAAAVVVEVLTARPWWFGGATWLDAGIAVELATAHGVTVRAVYAVLEAAYGRREWSKGRRLTGWIVNELRRRAADPVLYAKTEADDADRYAARLERYAAGQRDAAARAGAPRTPRATPERVRPDVPVPAALAGVVARLNARGERGGRA
jgi:DNA-binding MarR family transcriptional regulator